MSSGMSTPLSEPEQKDPSSAGSEGHMNGHGRAHNTHVDASHTTDDPPLDEDSVTLFDVPSKLPCTPFSPYALSTRFLLNYKGIPYKTEWIDFPDVDRRLTSLGVPPNENWPFQTVPAIKIPGRDVMKDSDEICLVIEDMYHSKKTLVRPNDTDVKHTLCKFRAFFSALGPLFSCLVPYNTLDDHNAAYIVETRLQNFGSDPKEMIQNMKDPFSPEVKNLWEDATHKVVEFDEVLNKNCGPFVFGSIPSYADISISAHLKFIEQIDPQILEKFLNLSKSGRLREVWDASKIWQTKFD